MSGQQWRNIPDKFLCDIFNIIDKCNVGSLRVLELLMVVIMLRDFVQIY